MQEERASHSWVLCPVSFAVFLEALSLLPWPCIPWPLCGHRQPLSVPCHEGQFLLPTSSCSQGEWLPPLPSIHHSQGRAAVLWSKVTDLCESAPPLRDLCGHWCHEPLGLLSPCPSHRFLALAVVHHLHHPPGALRLRPGQPLAAAPLSSQWSPWQTPSFAVSPLR